MTLKVSVERNAISRSFHRNIILWRTRCFRLMTFNCGNASVKIPYNLLGVFLLQHRGREPKARARTCQVVDIYSQVRDEWRPGVDDSVAGSGQEPWTRGFRGGRSRRRLRDIHVRETSGSAMKCALCNGLYVASRFRRLSRQLLSRCIGPI